MAWTKFPHLITYENTALYDVIHPPGGLTPVSGVFRCPGCGHTIVGENGRKLPPQNHHQHQPAQGAVRWQLLVRSSMTHPTI